MNWPRNITSKIKTNSKENNTNLITQSNKKVGKTVHEIKNIDSVIPISTRLETVISTRLETVFSQCRNVPPSVKRILTDKRKESSDYICNYDKKENIRNMINLFDVAYAHRQTTEIPFDMLTCITLEKACDEWNF